jgi:hypothetical protein
MSIEQNQSIVLQFYKAFDNQNIEQTLAILTPNFLAHNWFILMGLPVIAIANLQTILLIIHLQQPLLQNLS